MSTTPWTYKDSAYLDNRDEVLRELGRVLGFDPYSLDEVQKEDVARILAETMEVRENKTRTRELEEILKGVEDALGDFEGTYEGASSEVNVCSLLENRNLWRAAYLDLRGDLCSELEIKGDDPGELVPDRDTEVWKDVVYDLRVGAEEKSVEALRAEIASAELGGDLERALARVEALEIREEDQLMTLAKVLKLDLGSGWTDIVRKVEQVVEEQAQVEALEVREEHHQMALMDVLGLPAGSKWADIVREVARAVAMRDRILGAL